MFEIKSYFQGFISLFYPKACVSCGNVLVLNEDIICTFCLYNLPKTNFHLQEDTTLDDVFKGRAKVENTLALYYFHKKGGVQQMIHLLKYRNRPDIGVFLGELLGNDIIKANLNNNFDLIIPVPLHPKKEKIRGYNQSEMIARGISKVTNIPIDNSSVKRNLFTTTQTKKGRIKRWENVKSAFVVENKSNLQNKHILIVDDIITTGATVEACINSVLEIPDTKVSVACLGFPID